MDNYRANIQRIDDTVRPQWSVMIPVYNCAKYLAQTLESVLAQAPDASQMQIEVVDDCSTDNPEKVVQEVGKGRVAYFRQPTNLGHTGNFETCLKRSKGLWVHQLHGDDYVLPGFYAKHQEQIDQHPELGASFCQTFSINERNQYISVSQLIQSEAGIIPEFLYNIARLQKIYTPSIVVKRAVYEELGGFDTRLTWCEEWEMWARIAANYPMAYIPEALAVYRVHSSSNTARYSKSAEKIADLARGVAIINNYLPESKKKEYSQWSRNYYAESWAMGDAANALAAGDKELARKYIKLVFSLANRPVVFMQAAKLWVKTI